MVWSEYVRVNSHDCDKNRIVRPTSIFRMVQEAAFLQLRNVGQDETEMHEAGRAYIVSQLGIDVKKPLMMNDNVEIRTWENNSVGAKFMRYYAIFRGGEEIISGECVCALVDLATGHLIRVRDSGYVIGDAGEGREATLDARGAVRHELCYAPAGDFAVTYTFIDRNDHMNNTCYADMMYSAIPGASNKYMTAISISYLRPAKLGDVLKLYVAEEDGVYYVKSMLPSGDVCALAAIKAEKI